jgi:two-component system sensor histidine kinase BaeS
VKLTVGNKLFLSVLSVTLFIISLIVGLAGWSLRQGFSNYLSQTELNRQELLVKRLQEIYGARGDWGLFTGSETSWQNFVESVLLLEQQKSSSLKIGQYTPHALLVLPNYLLSVSSLSLSVVNAPELRTIELAQNSYVKPDPVSNLRPAPKRVEGDGRPPPNAFLECRGKSEGDTVMHSTPDGIVSSTCINSPDGLVARPVRPDQTPRSPPALPNEQPLSSPKSTTTQRSPTKVDPGAIRTLQSLPSDRPPAKANETKAPERAQSAMARRFILLDPSGQWLAGIRTQPSDSVLTRPLMHEGKMIGKLGIVVAASSSMIDQAFIDHSLYMLLIVASVAIVLSVLASLWMAAHLKSSLRQVTLAARRLASGEYSIRIETRRSDEFGDLVRDFNRLAHALEQHENNRRLWVSQTSHELRTPVSILRAHIEALLDGVRSPGRQEYEVLLKETLRLAKLISDLNDLARADSGALAFQKGSVDLTGLVNEMIESFEDRFDKQQIKITAQLTETALVFGDASRLSQLCANLFENTLRYTDSGGQLHIVIEHKGLNVVWVIEDSSPGVESTTLASLFDPFFRTEQSRHRETGGSGLGLAICKSIVSAHEGNIQAEHSKLGGLKITITLPGLESK